MIIPKNGKSFLKYMILTFALQPLAAVGSSMMKNIDASGNTWVHRALLLDPNEFIQVCKQVFLRQEHLQKNSYLMSDYATEVSDLCQVFAPNPEQGTCRMNDFNSIGSSFQKTFFQHASNHMDIEKLPINVLMSMGDAGYIVSDKSKVELNSMRNDLCVELHLSFGDEFLAKIPGLDIPDIPKINIAPQVETQTSSGTELNIGEDLLDTGNINNGSFEIMEIKDDHALSIGSIIGISCAVALCIALFFYSEARRRDRAARSLTQSRGDDGVMKMWSSSEKKEKNCFRSGSTTSSGSSSGSVYTSVEDIRGAINNANWDLVYKLASQLAENDDGLSISSSGLFKDQDRSHLADEDQERTKVLDELVDKGDWTGLAVTAALYAGETSNTPHDQSSKKRSTSKVQRPPTVRLPSLSSSRNQDIEEGQSSMEHMVGNLSEALTAGDWSQVNYFATKIKDERGGNSFDTDSQAFVLSPHTLSTSTSSIVSANTNDAELSKKQTIEKLMRAGKWKGVSIMANMYEMETKQSNCSSSPTHPNITAPSHQYKDRRSLRTKELQHSDRVQENIVGWRQDP